MSELAFFLAVRLAAALGSGLLHAYCREHHYGSDIGYHLEELIGYVVAAHLKAYLQCVAEAEEENIKVNPSWGPKEVLVDESGRILPPPEL